MWKGGENMSCPYQKPKRWLRCSLLAQLGMTTASGATAKTTRIHPNRTRGQRATNQAPAKANPEPIQMAIGTYDGAKKTFTNELVCRSRVALSRSVTRHDRQKNTPLSPIIQARSRFCILTKNRNGTSAISRRTVVNSSEVDEKYIRISSSMRPGSWMRSIGLILSYCPRDRTCQKP